MSRIGTDKHWVINKEWIWLANVVALYWFFFFPWSSSHPKAIKRNQIKRNKKCHYFHLNIVLTCVPHNWWQGLDLIQCSTCIVNRHPTAATKCQLALPWGDSNVTSWHFAWKWPQNIQTISSKTIPSLIETVLK